MYMYQFSRLVLYMEEYIKESSVMLYAAYNFLNTILISESFY